MNHPAAVLDSRRFPAPPTDPEAVLCPACGGSGRTVTPAGDVARCRPCRRAGVVTVRRALELGLTPGGPR